jgi:hypothetical protein
MIFGGPAVCPWSPDVGSNYTPLVPATEPLPAGDLKLQNVLAVTDGSRNTARKWGRSAGSDRLIVIDGYDKDGLGEPGGSLYTASSAPAATFGNSAQVG